MVPVKCSTMNGISSKSLKTLEFDKVVDRLAAKTETTVGRELALGLQPSTDYQEVLRRQRLLPKERQLPQSRPLLKQHIKNKIR